MRAPKAAVGVVACLSLATTLAAPQPAAPGVAARDGNERFEVRLRSRRFLPAPDRETVLAELRRSGRASRHVLVQLDALPDEEERRALREAGLLLLEYIPDHTYLARIRAGADLDDPVLPRVRWVGRLLPADKLAEGLRAGGPPGRVLNESHELLVRVFFFRDVSLEEARRTIRKHGRDRIAPLPGAYADLWTVALGTGALRDLADEDSVQWIEKISPPSRGLNDGARAAVGAGIVRGLPPFQLHGTGIVIGEWDEGAVDTFHNDLSARAVISSAEVCSPQNEHATHVAGAAIGDGTNSSGVYAGIADGAELRSYCFGAADLQYPTVCGNRINVTDINRKFLDAVLNAVTVSNNSWGYVVGCPDGNCDLHGDYDGVSQNYDALVRGQDGRPVNIVFSAGNEGNDRDCRFGCEGEGCCVKVAASACPGGGPPAPVQHPPAPRWDREEHGGRGRHLPRCRPDHLFQQPGPHRRRPHQARPRSPRR